MDGYGRLDHGGRLLYDGVDVLIPTGSNWINVIHHPVDRTEPGAVCNSPFSPPYLEKLRVSGFVILGSDPIFPVEEPLGKFVRISGHRFRIIGVLEKKGSGAESSSSADLDVKIPFKTFQKLFCTRWRDVSVQVKIVSADLIAEATDELTGILRLARHLDIREKNDFGINEQKTLRETLAPIKLAIYSTGMRKSA